MPELCTQEQRSRIMASVKSKNTTPEIKVRQLVHKLGYRFRLHRRDLPGTPDIVFPGRRKIINVHGCFWHMHTCLHARRNPVRNAAYWQMKRERNASRDKRSLSELRRRGWKVMTIWECELRDRAQLAVRVGNFLSS